MSNLRFAFRQVIKNPAFSAVAIITLALGIGANTAIFSIVNSVLLRPLPYPNADRIMVLNESSGPGQDFSVALPDYFDWQKETKTFEHLACTHKESRNLSGIPGREAERVSTASVTRNFFNIIGLSPQIGRVFSEDEDKVGAPPVAIISDRIWQRIFNRSPEAIVVTPLLENLVGKYRTNLGLLLGAVGLVLLIACANLANLFAARGAARSREFAIRAAVGASRGQIVKQLLVESFVVAIIGGALGFFIALWARDALSILAPQTASRFQDIPFDLRVLMFTLVVASVTAVVFGLWPAWQSSRADVQLALKAGSQGSGDAPSAKRTRDWLVISQIALTLTLLIAAALVLKSFSRLQALSLGYEPHGMLTARLEMPWRTYNTRDKIDMFAKTLLDKVRTLPGVQSVAISSNAPLMGGWQTGFWREGTPQPTAADMLSADLEVVAGDYFSTFKAPLLRGRTLDERDTKDSPRVIVVDQAMADKYFKGEDPIGKRLMVDAGNDEEGYVASEIVGVVAPMRFHAIDEMAPLPVIYCSLGQAQRTSLTLFVRSTSGLVTLERPIRDAISSIDPALPLFDVRPLTDP